MTIAAQRDRVKTPPAALGLVAVTVLLLAGTIPIANLAKRSSGVGAGFLLVLVGFLAVGIMLVRTRPRNPIGWSMLVAALFGGVTAVAGTYAVAASAFTTISRCRRSRCSSSPPGRR